MASFVLEAESAVPYYVRYAVEAETEDQALIIGARVADDVNGDEVWRHPSIDREASSRITVTIVPYQEQDLDDLPRYHAPARPCDVGGASAAPALRHLARDMVREMTDVIQACQKGHSADVDLFGAVVAWRDYLQASL